MADSELFVLYAKFNEAIRQGQNAAAEADRELQRIPDAYRSDRPHVSVSIFGKKVDIYTKDMLEYIFQPFIAMDNVKAEKSPLYRPKGSTRFSEIFNNKKEEFESLRAAYDRVWARHNAARRRSQEHWEMAFGILTEAVTIRAHTEEGLVSKVKMYRWYAHAIEDGLVSEEDNILGGITIVNLLDEFESLIEKSG